jgi:hypothetical protein
VGSNSSYATYVFHSSPARALGRRYVICAIPAQPCRWQLNRFPIDLLMGLRDAFPAYAKP